MQFARINRRKNYSNPDLNVQVFGKESGSVYTFYQDCVTFR